MSNAKFLSIAGRWQQHVKASGIDKTLPRKELGLAMLMFYAGFSAALDATVETADYPESEAMQLLNAMQNEVKQIAALAERLTSGSMPS